MSEKPGKRLMGWKQYLTKIGMKISLSTISVASACAGVAGIVFCFLTMMWSIFRPDYMFPLPEYIPLGCGIVVLFCFSLQAWLWQRQIKPVSPVALSNASDLLAVDTLVRPSDLPPTHQQAELLRAPTSGQETPPEELLRATATRGPEG